MSSSTSTNIGQLTTICEFFGHLKIWCAFIEFGLYYDFSPCAVQELVKKLTPRRPR